MAKSTNRKDLYGNTIVVGGMAGNDKFPGEIRCHECEELYEKRPPSHLIRAMYADGWRIEWINGQPVNLCPLHAR